MDSPDSNAPQLQFLQAFPAPSGRNQGGPRTFFVRSAWAGRGGQENPGVSGPDNPLRSRTVRGPKNLRFAENFERWQFTAALTRAYSAPSGAPARSISKLPRSV